MQRYKWSFASEIQLYFKRHGEGRALLKDSLCFSDNLKQFFRLGRCSSMPKKCSTVQTVSITWSYTETHTSRLQPFCVCVVESDLKETFSSMGQDSLPKPALLSPYTITLCHPLIRNSTQRAEWDAQVQSLMCGLKKPNEMVGEWWVPNLRTIKVYSTLLPQAQWYQVL